MTQELTPGIWRRPEATAFEGRYVIVSRLDAAADVEELGYRRAEWKCDNKNERSKAAALRLGFQYEGLFRKHMIVKGKNRDTAWFSITDDEWPGIRANFEAYFATPGLSLRELNQRR